MSEPIKIVTKGIDGKEVCRNYVDIFIGKTDDQSEYLTKSETIVIKFLVGGWKLNREKKKLIYSFDYNYEVVGKKKLTSGTIKLISNREMTENELIITKAQQRLSMILRIDLFKNKGFDDNNPLSFEGKKIGQLINKTN